MLNIKYCYIHYSHFCCCCCSSSSFIIFFFFLLSKTQGSKCGFFKWHDQLAPGHHLSLSQSDYPLCSCGAGPCRLMLETSQPNAGRLYFICPITKVSLYSFDLLHHISSSSSLSLFIYICFNRLSKTKKKTSFESLSSSTHPPNFLVYNPKISNFDSTLNPKYLACVLWSIHFCHLLGYLCLHSCLVTF